MKSFKFRVVTLAVLVAACALVAYAPFSASAGQAALQTERQFALNTVRLINTAELYCKASTGRYGSFVELIASGELERRNDGYFNLDATKFNMKSEADFLPGWKLGLVVAPDGSAYKLSLIQKGPTCAYAFFSDEVGVIYHGKAIDCKID